MKDGFSVSDASALAATSVEWLVESGLRGSDVPGLVAGLCHRLNAGGVGVERAGCAILTLHPQIVSQEIAWRSNDDSTTTTYYSPKMMEENPVGPYNHLALNRISYQRFPLGERGERDGHARAGAAARRGLHANISVSSIRRAARLRSPRSLAGSVWSPASSARSQRVGPAASARRRSVA